ncbi:MAG: glycosyltransferase family 4 protein [Flavobacteriales bacterium]|nr:glycosyltransferase family 4 protein [Flavobacteriales bacterium]
MDRPLNIAHCVEGYAPSSGGMAEVVRQLSERMAAAGHRVTVLTSADGNRSDGIVNGVSVLGFAVHGNAVNGIHGDAEAYVNALRSGGFDIITFFAAQQWATDAALPHMGELPGRKVFVPTGFSALRDPRWAGYYKQMPHWLAAMDLNVFHTEDYQDAAFARDHGITRAVLIPNGASEEEFEAPQACDFRTEQGVSDGQALITHIGGFTGIKGQREALEIFIHANTGDAVLALIGNGIGALERVFKKHWRFAWLRLRARLKSKRILFLELDRGRTLAALRQSDLFLFPSQLECSPIVLFEAMAAGVPFLASDAGNSAEITRWSGGGWVLPGTRDAQGLIHADRRAGARRLEEVLHDRAVLRRSGESGRKAWKERFTWRRIAELYVEAYLRIAQLP